MRERIRTLVTETNIENDDDVESERLTWIPFGLTERLSQRLTNEWNSRDRNSDKKKRRTGIMKASGRREKSSFLSSC